MKKSVFLGGWEIYTPLKFVIKHQPKESMIHVTGWENGQQVFDSGQIFDRSNASLKGGRLGVFTMSQKEGRWTGLSYK